MEKIEEELLDKIKDSIKNTVPKEKIGLAFSGGVDSSLLAKLCKDLEYDLTLLTIGFPDSHDILFAKKINKQLKLSHKIYEIKKDSFSDISHTIKEKIKTDNLSWLENSIAFYYISKLANANYISTVITANGIDELFCGYNAYRSVIVKGAKAVNTMMESKIENELNMMNTLNNISSEFNVNLVQPFLSAGFIEFAKTIPIFQKIKGEDDLIRKHIIRNLAQKVGVPEMSATKRKKALQYGSLIHKVLMKIK